jgi:hypothetical protein
MSAARFYAGVALLLVIGMVAIVSFPAEALIILSLGIPFSIVGAMIATFYLSRIFRRQPVPRSRFFRMLIESFFALLLIGVWVGYLSLARVLERAAASGADVPTIPAPPPNISSPISALIVIIVFVGPIRFAVEVYRRRKLSSQTNQPTTDDDDALDREN